jgi:hypothetical protein
MIGMHTFFLAAFLGLACHWRQLADQIDACSGTKATRPVRLEHRDAVSGSVTNLKQPHPLQSVELLKDYLRSAGSRRISGGFLYRSFWV